VSQENSALTWFDVHIEKVAGIVIAVCAALSIVAIAAHPQVTTHSRGDLLAQVIALGPMDRFVHGALMVMVVALVWGLAVFSIRLGFTRATVLAGFIAYTLGAMAWIGAMLIDGFLTPAIATRFAGTPGEQDAAINLLRLCAISIQILTVFGLVWVSVGIVKWSGSLLTSAGVPRTVGIIGIVAGLLPPAVVLFSGMTMSPHSLGAIVIVHAVWYFGVAILLFREAV
jgi:hypothetical protein